MFLYLAGVLLAKSSHVKTDRDQNRDAEETEENRNMWKNGVHDNRIQNKDQRGTAILQR